MPVAVPTSTDPSPIAAYTGAARWLHWAIGGGEILAVGLLLPLAILAVGTPIVLVVRMIVELAQRL